MVKKADKMVERAFPCVHPSYLHFFVKILFLDKFHCLYPFLICQPDEIDSFW